MSRIIRYSILIAILFSLSNCKQSKTDVLYDRKYIDQIKAARTDAGFYLSANLVPGGNFAVAKNGKIIYSEGMGLASEDLNVPATRNTKFRIGQVSEVFTALIYQKMVEEGTLQPDSVVQYYYPGFPEKKFPLPIHHLVSQTSGIREPNENEKDWRGLNISSEQGLDSFKADSLLFTPGMYMLPSMFNYNLLGVVMEKATNKKFHSILEEYVTDTLNLKFTEPDNPLATIKGRSDFFDHNFIAQVVKATTRDMRYKAPSEGLLSNAEDLVKLGNAILYSDYFTTGFKEKLFEPVLISGSTPSRMANGWILMTDNSGRKIYGRSGTVTGGGAALLIYPDENLVVACAVNVGSLSDDYPVFAMAQHFFSENEKQSKENTPAENKEEEAQPDKK
ncbi:serine hydrolase domain-containing protein [Mariniphaga anaerophila]|uniref:serine hydrolase domain-containing protein n=1 Tax=Mariniphaga anaerophila TaxID=1484053 RepID=UPI0015871261|nr:serine hydrolase domain-containing protein [Mariniphaga anaerophila]